MKRMMMAAMLLVGMTPLMAQTFEFQYQGRSLDDGATVTITAEENVWGELACETNPSGNPTNGLMLKLLSGTSADVKAELQIEENTWDNAFVQWCMGGVCVPLISGDYLSKNVTVNGSEQVQLDVSRISAKGHLLVKMTVTKSLEKRSVYVKFTYGEASSLRGDLNNDGFVNAADVVELVNIITGKQ